MTETLADLAERLLRWKHLEDHSDCRPGPVERCADPEYASDWAAIEAARSAPATDPGEDCGCMAIGVAPHTAGQHYANMRGQT